MTGMSIQVTKHPLQVDLSQDDDMSIITSDWIDPKTEKLINNRRYRVALFGVVDGRNVDLLPISTTSPYLSFINGPYDKYPEGGTDGVEELSIKPALQFVDGRLHIQQLGLKRVEVYGMNGMLVASSAAGGTDNLTLSVPREPTWYASSHKESLHKRIPINNYPITKERVPIPATRSFSIFFC